MTLFLVMAVFFYHANTTNTRTSAAIELLTETDRHVAAQESRLSAAGLLSPRDSTTFLSFLLTRNVTLATRLVYQNHVTSFIEWCRMHRLDWSCPEELDLILVTLFDELFFKGLPPDVGTRIVTALAFFLPAVSRLGLAALPRAQRSLRGWRTADPQRERLPLPRAVVAAMVGAACHAGFLVSGLKWWVQFRTYLRPGEIDKLRVFQLVMPTASLGVEFQWFSLILSPPELESPGKTGAWDESVLIDRDPELLPLLHALVHNRHPQSSLWGSSASDPNTFSNAASQLNLLALRPCRYALRHGGASDDLITRHRDLMSIKKRGRWVSDSSLKRYAKESKLAAEVRKVNPLVLAYGQQVLADLHGVISGHRPIQPPLPP